MTQSDSGPMTPVRSASGMNSFGGTMPAGRVVPPDQRLDADDAAPVSSSISGW